MNRILTAAVAFAVGLGMAGLAQAQMNTPPSQSMSPTGGTSNYGAQQTPGSQTERTSSGVRQISASQAQIEQAQQQLKAQGLYRGQVDGVMGPETQTAVSQFQRQQGLPTTSQLDQQTLARLNGGQEGSPQPQSMSPSAPSSTQSPPTQSPAGGMTGTGTTGTSPGGSLGR